MHTFWIKLVNSLLVIAVILGYNGILHNREQEETIAQLEFALENQQTDSLQEQTDTSGTNYQDGTYEGEGQGYGGTIVVQAVVAGGKLTELNLISAEKEDEAYLNAASAVLQDMLEMQSADADAVSGATFSSNGIIEAAADALRKAEEAA
ncbi:MAG: FMN-binding protein [Ruminococcus sp.]